MKVFAKPQGLGLVAALVCALASSASRAETPAAPWMNTGLPADARADLLVKALTEDEKIQLVFGFYSTDAPAKAYQKPAEGRPYTAGFVGGIARLGIPAQWQTDAGLGVSTHRTSPSPRGRTSLPSNLATASTFDRQLAYRGGVMIGREARLSGHNILLAGGINLLREPRGGRNFEYAGEDPLLAGLMVGEEIKGIQSNHIISTIKHFAFNNQETNRFTVDVHIADAAARQSDLLAFELALEIGDPGSVMCSYNRLNGAYACENDQLLNQVLKKDWGFPGYVMSDWGATHSTIPAALAGLDQESGYPFDKSPYFDAALKEAVDDGYVPQARLDDMVRRILRTMIAKGLFDDPVTAPNDAAIDFTADGSVTQADAESGMVLLKNDRHLLPLSRKVRRIAIIGGHADAGVLSGGGSSQVYPQGGLAVPNEGPNVFPGPMVFDPSSPVKALARRTRATLTYLDGKDVAAAADLAAHSDLVIVFAVQWMGESLDAPDLNLPNGQDALIAAVAARNPKTVVVLETGGPVLMPWASKVGAILEAWYPGTRGGEAIARILTGEVSPSGHLAATFPASLDQLPRPKIDGDLKQETLRVSTDYDIEGAAVGYKWFDVKGLTPAYPFGFGLSYTRFGYSGLKADVRDGHIQATFKVRNLGRVAGAAAPQIYVSPVAGGWEAPKRLAGFDKPYLKAGAGKTVALQIDPRLLAVYDSQARAWIIAEGDYNVSLRENAGSAAIATQRVHLSRQVIR